MLIQFMGCSTPDDEESKIVNVKLFLNHGNHSGRNLKKNIALTEGIGTELIGVIPSEQGFNQNYIDESNVTDWSLTDLEQNIMHPEILFQSLFHAPGCSILLLII